MGIDLPLIWAVIILFGIMMYVCLLYTSDAADE